MKLACIQFCAGPDINSNLKELETAIREAARQGAHLIATPENSCHILASSQDKLTSAFTEKEHPFLPVISNLAAELRVAISLGSITIKLPTHKLANRSYFFSDSGEIIGRYDKIHLFDVDLPTGEKHRESEYFEGGASPVLVDMGVAIIGLSICYDIRFAYLYRRLAQAGAQILMIPAAFTVPTGQAHWEILLRARAIETGSFVMAAAQTGDHEGGRKTWGHSMIIDPWGRILAQAEARPDIIYADIILDDVQKIRSSIPALQHDRDISLMPVQDGR